MQDWNPDDVRAEVTGSRRPSDSRLVLDEVIVEDGDYSGLKLDEFVTAGCRFSNSRFEDMRIRMATFGAGSVATDFVGCSFDGSRLEFSPGGIVNFVNCTFRDAALSHWTIAAGDVIGCTFSGTIKKSIFRGSVEPLWQSAFHRVDNRYEGNDFSRARMVEVEFRGGVDLRKQKLPEGPEYLYLEDAQAAVERARPIVAQWTDEKDKSQADFLLQFIEKQRAAGQRQVFQQSGTGRNARIWPQLCAALRGDPYP
ncbi:hypothetical protein ACIB24_14125 [Spongisporangium articulatum]|uniref:Pentapeptide repeat-containing protein n=1 Tax=Spongisporangium articulatum TaxID=3362603 RepID=A0ABW8AQJ0_9ACTN